MHVERLSSVMIMVYLAWSLDAFLAVVLVKEAGWVPIFSGGLKQAAEWVDVGELFELEDCGDKQLRGGRAEEREIGVDAGLGNLFGASIRSPAVG
jgi:hypothetical protein